MKKMVDVKDYRVTKARNRVRRIGRGVGRGTRAVGKGVYEFGAGFVEELKIPKPSPRKIGGAMGRGTREAVGALGRIEFKPPEHFWGPRTETREQKIMPSHLPMEVQQAMVKYLAEMYPSIYQALWSPNIRVSEFIGKLKTFYPDVYDDARHMVYSYLRQPTTGYPGQRIWTI